MLQLVKFYKKSPWQHVGKRKILFICFKEKIINQRYKNVIGNMLIEFSLL